MVAGMRSRGLVFVCALGCGTGPLAADPASDDASSGDGAVSRDDDTLGVSATGSGVSTTGVVEETGAGGGQEGAGTTEDEVATCGVPDPEAEPGTKTCNVWAQDCPPGCKCAPYSADANGNWDALKCVPVVPNAGRAGDGCTLVENIASGIDDCAEGFVCFWGGLETKQGWCVELCQGAPAKPSCTDPTAACRVAADAVLNLCVGACDPLEQNCPDGQVCRPEPGDAGSLTCLDDVSGDQGQVFDGCDSTGACDAGLTCVLGLLAEECTGNCCLPFCDLDAPVCPGVGQECLPWFGEGPTPAGLEDLGLCALPG